MQLPREVIVGVNILDRIGEICTKLGFHGTALVVSGPVTYPLAGVGVAKSAAKAGLRVDHIIVEESTEAVLNQIIERSRRRGRPSCWRSGAGRISIWASLPLPKRRFLS